MNIEPTAATPVVTNKLLDSSAISKYALKEPGWQEVEQHLVGCSSIELALKETANALWKKIMKKEVELQSAKQIVKMLSGIIWCLDQAKHLDRALEIATKHKLSVYDALFLASAEAESYVLVSCDLRQLEVAASLGINSIRIEP
ncbi:MAG: type II toxin-antitoxin system VapC family toxin [Nitrososphaerales archaeon]